MMAENKAATRSGRKTNQMAGKIKVDVNLVGGALQDTLVELTDLHLRAKQAHWNLVGPHFRSRHKQLDKLTNDVRAASDDVAERAIAIGYSVDGRPGTVAKSTPLGEFPAGQIRDDEAIDLITSSLKVVCDNTRERVNILNEPDPVTQDLLNGVLEMLEKHHWMFAAQRY